MADINNSFTIDAAQAIKTLNTLNATLAQTNRSLRVFQSIANSNMGGGFAAATASLQQMQAAAQAATGAVNTGSQDANRSVRGLGISFQDMTRIIASQILFNAIGGITQAFTESAEAAKDFELQMLRIEAIAEGSQSSIQGIEQRVDELSIALGRDLTETSSAVFEALQNDLGTTSETFKLLEGQAQDLALVTGGTLVQSVNALSSVIKSYAQTNEEAEENAAILFGTINAGRITLADLENSMGTILPLSAKVGTSFKDVSTALATVTLSGTKANVATTQLRNVFNKLIKPTELLQERFTELGFVNFEELQNESEGFADALNKITDGKTSEEVARMFNTIRGNLGVLNVLTQQGELFQKTLDNVNESGERLGDTIKTFKESDAFAAEVNAAELGVVFKELGKDTLVAKNAAVDLFQFFVDDASDAKVAIAAVTLGLGTLAVQAIRASTLMTASLAGLGPIALGLAASFAAMAAANKAIDFSNSFAGLNDEIEALRISKLEELNQQIRDEIPQSVTEALNGIENFTQGATDGFDTVISKAADLRNQIDSIGQGRQDGFEGLIQRFGSRRLELLKQVEKSIDDIDKTILDNTSKIADINKEIFDFQFDRSLTRLSDDDALEAQLKRARTQSEKLKESLDNLDLGKQSQEAALESNKLTKAYAEAALRAADAAGNTQAIAQAEGLVTTALFQQQKIYEKIAELNQSEGLGKLDEQRAAIEKLNAAQQRDAQQLIEDFKAIRKASLEGRDTALDVSFLEKDIKKFADSLKQFDDNTLVDLLGFEDAASALSESVAEGLSNVVVDWTQSIDGLRAALNGQEFEAVVKLNAQIAQATTDEVRRQLSRVGTDQDSVSKLSANEKALTQVIEDQVTARQKQIIATNELAIAREKANAFIKEATASGVNPLAFGVDTLQDTLLPLQEQLKNIGTLSESELAKLSTGLREGIIAAGDLQGSVIGGLGGLSVERVDAFQQSLSALFDAVRAQQELNTSPFNQEALDEAKAGLEAIQRLELDQPIKDVNDTLNQTSLRARGAAEATRSIATAGSNAQISVNSLTSTTGNLSSAATSAAQAFDRMAASARDAAAAANAANNSNSSGFAFRGGQVNYRANGGDSRGQDTLPTMLSPEEFVMNSKSSRNFLPQLQAMNASTGSQSSGGDQNITIGDINVTSNSQLPSQTAREVGISIKRELRRGTFKL